MRLFLLLFAFGDCGSFRRAKDCVKTALIEKLDQKVELYFEDTLKNKGFFIVN